MKIKILSLCFIAHTAYIMPTTKRHLQAKQQQLIKQQDDLRKKTNVFPIIEACPTKPPKKYSGSREKVRLQKSIENLQNENAILRGLATQNKRT